MSNNSRNPYSFPDFSLRRLLLQGARAARGSPQLGTRMCDVERGTSKHDKPPPTTPSASPAETSHGVGSHTGSGVSPGSTKQVSLGETSQQPSRSPVPKHKQQRVPSCGYPPVVGPDTIFKTQDCPVCYNRCYPDDFFRMRTCSHYACRSCYINYLRIEILESRTDIACPQCADTMHPLDIHRVLAHLPHLLAKYEDFMVRRVLLADPDSRWCPAPDCSYAVIATGCASCPRIKCERPGCDINFCYHCKAEWHPDQTCDAARASRHSPVRARSGSISQDSQHRDEIKPCPRCQVLIVKMDDGSCNHMVCAVCGSEFCWLCMKVISDLHYLSPSGCTFWGKKPWSRKKKLLWQLGTLVGAPVGIALVAGIAVPAMIIGIPVWVGRKVHSRYLLAGKHKRNCAVLSGVIASVLVSPVLAGLAVAIGVPILLFYVYGVVPVSLCRAGCGVSTSRDGFKFDFDETGNIAAGPRFNPDAASVDAVSRIGATSIGEVSLSVASGSHVGGIGMPANAANASNVSTTAMAGSIAGHRLEVEADVNASETASAITCESEKSGSNIVDNASTKALAGSIINFKQNSSNISEDGASERVRFDNVCYVIDDRKDGSDVWSNIAPEELSADKASVGSCRSFRSSDRSFREDPDSTSLSSLHKRIKHVQHRLPKYNPSHRNSNPSAVVAGGDLTAPSSSSSSTAGGTIAIESDLEPVAPASPTVSMQPQSPQPQHSPIIAAGSTSANSTATPATVTPSTSKNINGRNMSKLAVLRSIFFSQNPGDGPPGGNSGGGSASDAAK